jgi:hypothetical protein
VSLSSLTSRLLLVAFRHTIHEPDADNGLLQVAAIAGQDMDHNALHEALTTALREGYIHDPVQLRPGALQCHWRLELTPRGVDEVRALLRRHGKTADELLATRGEI